MESERGYEVGKLGMLMYISRWKIGKLVVKEQYDCLRRKRISRAEELDNQDQWP